MEAKLGVRFHQPLPGRALRPAPGATRSRRTSSTLEADFTARLANGSAFDYLQLRFPATTPRAALGLRPANPGIPSASIPPNADIRHAFHDVFGVRLGGDYNLLPDQLAVRAGAFFETQAADSVYQNLDFEGAMRFGIAAGGTYRLHVGPAAEGRAVELMLGYGHVFFGALRNDGPGGVNALSGAPCAMGAPSGGVCPDGTPAYRTPWPVNLGRSPSAIRPTDQNVGASCCFEAPNGRPGARGASGTSPSMSTDPRTAHIGSTFPGHAAASRRPRQPQALMFEGLVRGGIPAASRMIQDVEELPGVPRRSLAPTS